MVFKRREAQSVVVIHEIATACLEAVCTFVPLLLYPECKTPKNNKSNVDNTADCTEDSSDLYSSETASVLCMR